MEAAAAITNPRSCSQLYSSWNPPYNPTTPPQNLSRAIKFKFKFKTSLKPLLTLSNSLKTCSNSNQQFQSHEEGKFDLPVVIRHSGKVSRYFLDGDELKIVTVDGANAFALSDLALDFGGGLRKLGGVLGVKARRFFLPREVSGNYIEYVKWKFLHRVFSSALQVLATQAMFRAIGIGYRRSLPSAAALNWVLKDGLGRLGRCIYTASLASSFDTNLKRVRFLTSVMFSLSIGVELLTPIFPKHFLLLATIANISKQISLSCYLATGSAVHRSFAIADNIGEVSAKAQIQTVCFDIVGLLLAATLNISLRNNQRLLSGLPFMVYPVFAALDLLGIYQGLKHVHLQTLTKDRLESIINTLIQQQYVPTPAEVSNSEGSNLFWSKGKELLPIRIGCLNSNRKMPKLSMSSLRSLKDEDNYFICVESLKEGSSIIDCGILVCLREGAATSDIIMALLQACYIRKDIVSSISWLKYAEALDPSDSVRRKWFDLMEESKRFASENLGPLNEKMSGIGWACKNVLLSTGEQARYSFVTD